MDEGDAGEKDMVCLWRDNDEWANVAIEGGHLLEIWASGKENGIMVWVESRQ